MKRAVWLPVSRMKLKIFLHLEVEWVKVWQASFLAAVGDSPARCNKDHVSAEEKCFQKGESKQMLRVAGQGTGM
jgi:hypothetical protein